MNAPHRRLLIDTLKDIGFTLDVHPEGLVFRGSISVAGKTVPCELRYSSTFAEPPQTIILDASALPRSVIPHLDEAGELCVVDRRQYIADRYHLAGQALGILEKAKQVLEAGLTRHATSEIAREFPQHFGGTSVSIDFGAYEGPIFVSEDAAGHLVLRLGTNGKATAGYAVATEREISFTEKQKRPDTFGELLDWAKYWDPALADKIQEAVARAGPRNPICVICAPNGMVAVRLDVLAKGTTFQEVYKSPRAWTQAVSGAFGRTITIERFRGVRTDLDYVLGRNGNGVAPLKDKSVCLVGCGAIGGYLSIALAQLGAGSGVGSLTLIDPDTLSASNVGRHALGIDMVGRPKVEGCRDRINAMLPGRLLTPHCAPAEARFHALAASDIVIDATGEQGVSEMLNQWRLDSRPESSVALLHVWIAGRGAAVQTFFSSDPEFACRRCLQVDYAQPQRHWPLRPDAPIALEAGCGEAIYTPYGPSAPMVAAGLAAKHVDDWSRGQHKPLIRSMTLDFENTLTVKPANPPRAAGCPACGGP